MPDGSEGASVLYASSPYFTGVMHGISTVFNEGQSEKQVQLQNQQMETRLEIRRCTASPECGGKPEHAHLAVWTDVITGRTLKANLPLQANIRIFDGSTVYF